jgi:hypothetical protein
MNPVPAPTRPILNAPCASCGKVGVTLTLLTGYGSYYRCAACGRTLYQEHGRASGTLLEERD